MTARKDGTGLHRRGTSNSNDRGSAEQRRRRKWWVLEWFGDGETAPCYSCGEMLTYDTLQIDRIVPGALGGTYAKGNIRPACGPCNIRTGNEVKRAIAEKMPKKTLLRLCRLGLL